MKLTKQQIIDAALSVGFTDKDYGHVYTESEFDNEIGVEEYGCGEKLLKLFNKLGIKVTS